MLKTSHLFRVQTWHAYLRSYTHRSAEHKFIVFAQGRTGSWLLRDLVNCHPDIHADKEVLELPVSYPFKALEGLSSKHIRKKTVYGCHLQIKQIRDVQGQDVGSFLTKLHESGWKIIYLRRENYLRQSVSSMVAVQRRLWKSRQSLTADQTPRSNIDQSNNKFTLDCDRLLEWLRQREVNRTQEISALASLPFLELVYERDLRCSDQHQSTAQRIFEYLDLKPATVTSSLKRLGADKITDQIENYDEVKDMLDATGHSHFLHEI